MLKRHIFLILELAKRDVKSRYAGSSLGFFWAFLQPLLQLILFTFVFSTILKISLVGERGIENFSLFLFAGLLPWMSLQEMLVRSTTVLVDQATLVKKLAFPPHVLVGSILASALLHQGVAALLFVTVLACLGELRWTALALPALMGLQTLLVTGLCFFLAGLHVFFRDTAQMVAYFAQIWFYATPIVYPLSLITDPKLAGILGTNPAAVLVEAYRDVLLRGILPDMGHVGVVFLVGVVITYAGILLFQRWRSSYADLL